MAIKDKLDHKQIVRQAWEEFDDRHEIKKIMSL